MSERSMTQRAARRAERAQQRRAIAKDERDDDAMPP